MYIYVCLYIYVYDIYISAWDGTVFFYDFRLPFPINLFIFCRIPTDGNRQSTIGNLQLAISDRVYIWSAQKKLSKEVAIWAAAASIFANCWLVYLQDTLPLTPPALLFASILYLFFFFLLLSYPLLLLVRTLGRQFVNANAADRLRSRTVANWFSIQFMWHSHSYLDTWTYVHICMYKCTYMYSLINKLWSVCKKRKFPFFTKIFQLLN